MVTLGSFVFTVLAIFLIYGDTTKSCEGKGNGILVGDELGWNPAVDYSSWTAQHRFHVGNILVFIAKEPQYVFEVGYHTYQSCTTHDALGTYVEHPKKAIKVHLMHPGWHYFTSLDNFCKVGMKVAIHVEPSLQTARAPPAVGPVPLTLLLLTFLLLLPDLM